MKNLKDIQKEINDLEPEMIGKISDGSHTFNELYFHRMVLFSIICNTNKERSWKSKLHHDRTMYPNYFIVGIQTEEGQYSYHYHMEHWNYFEVPELEKAPEWDGHTPKDIMRLTSLIRPKYDHWIQQEIELTKDKGDEYYRACFNSAVKAYMAIMTDGHSGFSISSTKNIINRLIDRKPLSSLTGEDDEWDNDRITKYEDNITYQNKRCSSVFKTLYNDGKIEYSDVDRFICIDIDKGYGYYSGNIINKIKHLFPDITMPYYPPTNRIKVYCDDFLVDPKNGDYDHEAILYAMDGDERIDINIYMKEIDGKMVEITKDYYMADRKRRIKDDEEKK